MTNKHSNTATEAASLPVPIQRLKTQARCVAAASAIALIVCTLWTLRHVEYPQIESITLATTQEDTSATSHVPLDVAAFNAMIWRAPEVQVDAQQPRTQSRLPPAPKLNVSLIAITSDYSDEDARNVRRAALYDPTKNKLYQLAEGDEINSYTLTTIDTGTVTFTSGEHVATLTLRTDEPPLKLGRAQR